jgi:hypothetical protein
MVSHRRDVIRHRTRRECSRRIVRQENQKDSRPDANAYSDAETSEEFSKESVAYAIAYCFFETKENFADSIPDAEEQIKTQKGISYSNTERIALGNRDSICQSSGNIGTCSRKEGVAERLPFPGPNRRLRE